MLPPARTVKRLAAPLLVFILGMTTPQVMVAGVFLRKNLMTHTPLIFGTVCYITSTIPLLSKQLCLFFLNRLDCFNCLNCLCSFYFLIRLYFFNFFNFLICLDFLLLGFRRQNHHHLAAFHFGELLYHAIIFQVRPDTLDQTHADLLVSH